MFSMETEVPLAALPVNFERVTHGVEIGSIMNCGLDTDHVSDVQVDVVIMIVRLGVLIQASDCEVAICATFESSSRS